jgi:DNA integrity scanning protein DisA with diadenylate cyclase activity
VEWAERIRLTVAQDFDRVAKAFRDRLSTQTGQAEAETRLVLAILEQKRAETMENDQAGYFIRDWQELSDQVRQMISKDRRYQKIKDQRAARRQVVISPPQDNGKVTTS